MEFLKTETNKDMVIFEKFAYTKHKVLKYNSKLDSVPVRKENIIVSKELKHRTGTLLDD